MSSTRTLIVAGRLANSSLTSWRGARRRSSIRLLCRPQAPTQPERSIPVCEASSRSASAPPDLDSSVAIQSKACLSMAYRPYRGDVHLQTAQKVWLILAETLTGEDFRFRTLPSCLYLRPICRLRQARTGSRGTPHRSGIEPAGQALTPGECGGPARQRRHPDLRASTAAVAPTRASSAPRM